MRSQNKDFIFFEDAKNPILSIEGEIPGVPKKQAASFLASVGFSSPSSSNRVTKVELLESVNLKGVDLIAKRFETKVYLTKAIQKLREAYPRQWRNALIKVRVCDDTNGDRMCADEDARHTLSVSPVTVNPTALPRSVRLEVWSGRFLTLVHDPKKCEQQYSPLVLDLSGGGFLFSSPEQGAWFDLDDSGEAVRTGWLQSNSNAFLVRDLDGNGRIDSGAELFGTATRLLNGKRASNGFEALKELDANGDGVINEADLVWKELKLWIDLNHNGISERNELFPMARGNLKSINLNYVGMDELDINGNHTKYRSTYSRLVKGIPTPMQIIDVWFNTLIAD